jgi:hypothetical protein
MRKRGGIASRVLRCGECVGVHGGDV